MQWSWKEDQHLVVSGPQGDTHDSGTLSSKCLHSSKVLSFMSSVGAKEKAGSMFDVSCPLDLWSSDKILLLQRFTFLIWLSSSYHEGKLGHPLVGNTWAKSGREKLGRDLTSLVLAQALLLTFRAGACDGGGGVSGGKWGQAEVRWDSPRTHCLAFRGGWWRCSDDNWIFRRRPHGDSLKELSSLETKWCKYFIW